ncbi:IS4 family transposase [Haliangium ochraceum]|uniref:Transposase IS4 family protein n=2 Tax=Haliangium ochraceum TaxID=80816 RepID=D0LI35_HALO1|nr:IS4 family transposase [Haliangium ochraceum]ACY14864.1 transposase IS4 family protein [Haliangium ochraceum DSM 14365]ACY15427.1 transposase IS4 family protein [Haliangium ochraceum DSM 14365]ACY15935.1 transposase IS4 family protein [Haliangium ochraceum DSM 14365]
MHLSTALQCVASYPPPEEFSRLARDVAPEWIEQALEATGTATLRRRRLPMEQLVWLVIGMALFRDRPITEVVTSLDLALPSPGHPEVAPSAVAQARDRLGESPMAWLFAHSADRWAHQSAADDRWRGLALYGVDGTTLRVPDSEENRDHFGLANGGARGSSGYPVVRLAALMALRSHLLAAVSFGPYQGHGEYWYAADLWPCLPDNSLVIVDRHYWAANVLIPLQQDGLNRHWLIRGRKGLNYRVVEQLGPSDELAEVKVSPQARSKNPELPRTWTVRIIHYQRKGFRPQRLFTSLLDPVAYPADELVALYHERWEIELGYDEVKSKMLANVPLRSKSVDRARQEIWGLLIAYNLIRLEMARVAHEAGVPPTRISFVTVFRLICAEWLWCSHSKPGAIPRHLRNLRRNIRRFILPPRRTERSYPRAVKVKMSSYPRKRRPAQARPASAK